MTQTKLRKEIRKTVIGWYCDMGIKIDIMERAELILRLEALFNKHAKETLEDFVKRERIINRAVDKTIRTFKRKPK